MAGGVPGSAVLVSGGAHVGKRASRPIGQTACRTGQYCAGKQECVKCVLPPPTRDACLNTHHARPRSALSHPELETGELQERRSACGRGSAAGGHGGPSERPARLADCLESDAAPSGAQRHGARGPVAARPAPLLARLGSLLPAPGNNAAGIESGAAAARPPPSTTAASADRPACAARRCCSTLRRSRRHNRRHGQVQVSRGRNCRTEGARSDGSWQHRGWVWHPFRRPTPLHALCAGTIRRPTRAPRRTRTASRSRRASGMPAARGESAGGSKRWWGSAWAAARVAAAGCMLEAQQHSTAQGARQAAVALAAVSQQPAQRHCPGWRQPGSPLPLPVWWHLQPACLPSATDGSACPLP